ncbi:MAG: 3-isopropylmalate dehydratase small subunit [Planctomycetia bacterium]|nr:3-isopropylmalate dehydratase small subunit [Planctomycetia bacterium]
MWEKFITHTGIVAPMDRANVDTDQIMPKQFLKRVERSGFGQYLFYDWRFMEDGKEDPCFVLNHPDYRNATILLARSNFGSGSSREHAPWGLKDYGFRILIAPSFADIFLNNCFKNGILPIQLPEACVDELFVREKKYMVYHLTVDLEQQKISDEFGLMMHFEVDEFRKYCLLNALDDISLTLQHEDEILSWEKDNMEVAFSGKYFQDMNFKFLFADQNEK